MDLPEKQVAAPALKPMGLGLSMTLFLIPALLELGVMYALLPRLVERGVSPLGLYAVFMAVPALMLMAALLAHRLEGRALNGPALRDRFRLASLTGRQWACSVGVAVAMVLSYVAVWQLTGAWQSLILNHVQPEPAGVVAALGDQTHFVGVPLKGAWWLLGVWFVGYFFNVVGEELWWRGVILPRQELVHGRWTWLLHGVQWTMFHLFNLATVWMILPGALMLSWYCQRTRSTWPGLVAHGLLNAMAALRLVGGIVG